MLIFELKLKPSYYSKGSFNVSVDFDRYVRDAEGEVELILGKSGKRVMGRINRSANKNGTARISGPELKKWFRENYQEGDTVSIDLSSRDSIQVF